MNELCPVVVYDACVLYPALLRDFLVRLALARCVRAHWSRKIQDEWKRNLLRNQPTLFPARLERTTNLMERALPSALIEPDEALIAILRLPDLDDRHVLATAIQCRPSVIVTFNLRDFPEEELAPFGIEAEHPDSLAVRLLWANQAGVIGAARKQRDELAKPKLDADEYLAALRRQGLVQTSTLLAKYRDRL